MAGILRREIRDWLWWALQSLPGRVGAHLRRLFLKDRLALCGRRLAIEPGFWIAGERNIKIGDNASFGRDCIVEATAGHIAIGNECSFNARVNMGADFGRIEIGDKVIVGMGVTMRASNHRFDRSPDIPIRAQGHDAGEIVIGNDVWIGAHAVLLPGAHIGNHVVIAAGAVVRGPIPECSVAAGIPARVIRSLMAEESKAPYSL